MEAEIKKFAFRKYDEDEWVMMDSYAYEVIEFQIEPDEKITFEKI